MMNIPLLSAHISAAGPGVSTDCLFRKEKLQEAHQLQLFKANQRLLLEWSIKQSSEMEERGLPKNRAEAEKLLVEHRDWKVLLCYVVPDSPQNISA